MDIINNAQNNQAAHEESMRHWEQLDSLASTAAATNRRGDTRRFIGLLTTIIDTHPSDSQNVGINWLSGKKNVETFLQLCPDTAAFFRARDTTSVAKLVLTEPRLLASISQQDHELFIYEMVSKSNLRYVHWYRTALTAGTPNDVIARVILRLLREATAPTGDIRDDSFIEEFRNAYGILGFVDKDIRLVDASIWKIYAEKPSMWSVMSDDQLFEATRICEQKAPGIFLDNKNHYPLYRVLSAHVIGVHRDPETRTRNGARLQQLLIEVCTSVPSLSDVVSTIFKDLPLDLQRGLVERHHGGNYGILVGTSLALDDYELFERFFQERIITTNPFWAIWFTSRIVREHSGRSLPMHMQHKLEQYLLDNGYAFGVAQEEPGPDGVTVSFAIVDGVRYVQADGSSCPAGSKVMIKKSGEEILGQTMKTVKVYMSSLH